MKNNKQIIISIPESLMQEINKFLAEKAQGDTTQGMKKIMLTNAIFSFMVQKGWKFPKETEEEVNEILSNARFNL